MLGNFATVCRLLIFFKTNFFNIYDQNVKRIHIRPDVLWPDFELGPDLGPNCQQTTLAGKELRQTNTLLRTYLTEILYIKGLLNLLCCGPS